MRVPGSVREWEARDNQIDALSGGGTCSIVLVSIGLGRIGLVTDGCDDLAATSGLAHELALHRAQL